MSIVCWYAVPFPVPTPVAVKFNPTVFADAPINVKSVVPTTNIEYSTPTTKLPAVTVFLLINLLPFQTSCNRQNSTSKNS